MVSNPNAHIVELVNIKQGRTEGVHDYMQKVVCLAESAYVGVDKESQMVRKQVLGFFIEGLRDKDIKMIVMKDEPQILEAAYQKALFELKWKIQLEASKEYENEPMEVCYSRRQAQIEAVTPAKSEKGRHNEKCRRGSTNGTKYKTYEGERIKSVIM